jgi:Uncharacterized conserved protein (COG2071)
VRDLVIASWEADPESVRRAVPSTLEPLAVEGRFLGSLVAFHVTGGRLGKLAILPFSQLNARTYVSWKGEPAVFFLGSRVTAGGLPGRLLGAPYRQARLRVREGLVRAPGLGVAISFTVDGESEPGALGRHDLGLFERNGLRALRIRRGEARWRKGELLEPARADFLVALGLEVEADPELLYADRTAFETEVPPKGV